MSADLKVVEDLRKGITNAPEGVFVSNQREQLLEVFKALDEATAKAEAAEVK